MEDMIIFLPLSNQEFTINLFVQIPRVFYTSSLSSYTHVSSMSDLIFETLIYLRDTTKYRAYSASN